MGEVVGDEDGHDQFQAVDALLTMRSGLKTPMAEIPTPDLAVPYAAPKQVKTIADVQPMAPKKGCEKESARFRKAKDDDAKSRHKCHGLGR